jgi:hypothetical protein
VVTDGRDDEGIGVLDNEGVQLGINSTIQAAGDRRASRPAVEDDAGALLVPVDTEKSAYIESTADVC